MSQLLALIISIALGAIVTAIGYTFLGIIFSSGSVKAEAQRIMAQEGQIVAAITAYKAENLNQLKLGNSDPDGNLDYNDSSVLSTLVESRFLKEDILNQKDNSWFLPNGEEHLATFVKDEETCISLNHQHSRTKYPITGIVSGQFITATITASSSELVNGVPICNTPTASVAVCCTNP